MRLVAINRSQLVSSGRAYRQVLEWVLRTQFNQYQIVEATQPSWPQEWSDQLFVPAKNFEQRKRSRRFLNWVIGLGVDAGQWLDQVEAGATAEQTVAPPRALGGGVGRAYIIGDRVVKFTTDTKEAKRAGALIGLDVPNLARFHGVAEIVGAGTGKTLFAIVMNRVPNRIPGKYRVAANAVYNYLDVYDRPIVDVEQAAQEIMANTRFLPAKHRRDPDVRAGVLKILRATDAVYRRTGILLQDPHGGNVLMRGRDIEFFDVGRSSDYGDPQRGTDQIKQIA